MSTDTIEDAAGAAVATSTRFRTLGSFSEFKPESEDFTTYMERVEIYFAANDVPADKKVPVFLTFIGGTTYAILRNLLAPDSPISKPFSVLVEKLRDHFEPKPSIIAERFKFHRRGQNAGETITVYIAELRRLAVRLVWHSLPISRTRRNSQVTLASTTRIYLCNYSQHKNYCWQRRNLP